MFAPGVEQKPPAVLRNRQAEVIGDGFVHAEARRPPKGRGQIDALLLVIHAQKWRSAMRISA